MSSLFKKTVTRSKPESATITKGIAKWTDSNGKKHFAPVTATGKIRTKSEVYYGRYRDSDGIRREVNTECRDKASAEKVIADLRGRTEKIKSGIFSKAEGTAATWADVPLSDHIKAHESALRGLGRADSTVQHRVWFLNKVIAGLGWKRLVDFSRPQLEQWLADKAATGMGARNRNAHAHAMIGFAYWCVRAGRLMVNPFAGLEMLNEQANRRRERRAMSLDELQKLVAALTHGVNPASCKFREWRRYCRAVIYQTFMFSGLRYGELKSVSIGQLHLDADPPHIELKAQDTKARRAALQPIPAHLADTLTEYLAERRKRLLAQRGASAALPGVLEAAPLFDMSIRMIREFDLDLKAAGIPKMDAQGRTLDVHALRHSYCSLIARSGVNMQTAMRLMRHTTAQMTMRYSHIALTDLGGAIATLPEFKSSSDSQSVMAANSTVQSRSRQVARKSGASSRFVSLSGISESLSGSDDTQDGTCVSTNKNGQIQTSSEKREWLSLSPNRASSANTRNARRYVRSRAFTRGSTAL